MSPNKFFKHEGPWSDANDPLMCTDTGSWRSKRPVVDRDKCIFCGFCAIYCPVQVMEPVENAYFSPDLAYCKGCGICARECPKNAISMIPEGEFQK